MPVGKYQAITPNPFRILGIMAKCLKIEEREDICHTQRARGVPRTCRDQHLYNSLTNIVCLKLKLGNSRVTQMFHPVRSRTRTTKSRSLLG